MSTLLQVLATSRKNFPQRPACTMRWGYRTISFTYEALDIAARKLATFLAQQGVQPGDKVLIVAPNSPHWVVIFWGVLMRGAVIVPLNIQMTPATLEKIAQETQTKILFKTKAQQVLLPGVKCVDIEMLASLSDIDDAVIGHQTTDEIVEIIYTSGTTGSPKGVMLTHENLYSNMAALNKEIPINYQDKFLSVLPLSHIFEQTVGFLLPFSQGAEIIYTESFAFVPNILKERHITKMVVVPEFLKVIFSKIEEKITRAGKQKQFSNMLCVAEKINSKMIRRWMFYPIHKSFGGKLSTMSSGGAALSVELEKKWETIGVSILQGYGLSETSPVVSMNTYKDHVIGSVGQVLPGTEVKLTTDHEILVKGPNVFAGYYKNPKKTQEVCNAGWFATGDIGEFDNNGFLYIKGRKKYMILGAGGQNIYPEDIESELNKVPEVKDCCVLGIERTQGNVEIYAVLLTQRNDVDAILKTANQSLAPFQRVMNGAIWPEEDFPRSTTRKIQKEKVLSWVLTSTQQAKSHVKQQHSTLETILSSVSGVPVEAISGETRIISDLNLDSLLIVELLARIEDQMGIYLNETQFTLDTKVCDLEKILQLNEGSKSAGLKLKKWPRSNIVKFLRTIAQNCIVFPSLRCFMPVTVTGQENLQNLQSPIIFMPNHISVLDSLAMAMAVPSHLRKNLAFAAATDVLYQEYKSVAPLFEFLFNSFPFPRKSHENIKSGLDAMGKMLDQNFSIVIYPEGGISDTRVLQPLKRGTGLIATEMDAVIVPVHITGTADISPGDKVWPQKRGQVHVEFGRPLSFTRQDAPAEAMMRLTAAMKEFNSVPKT